MNESTNLLLVCSTLAVGGAERQWAILVPRLRERGFHPIVVTLRSRGRFFESLRAEGISVHEARMRNRFDLVGLRRALSYAKTAPNLVLTQSFDAQVVGEILARRLRVPHATAEHGGIGLARAPHRRVLLRYVAPQIDAVVAVSKSQLPELTRLGYRSERIHVIPNGIPPLIPIRSEAVTRSSLGLDESAFVMTLIASLRPEKRVDVFCAAVSQAHRRCPRIRGLIVGNGPDLKRARQLAAQSGAVVQTLGERDDVPDIIAASDAICLSSSAEGFPMVMLEAMSIGRPLVATSVGGIPEAVEHGRTGLLVPPGDTGAFAEALVELAQRPDRAAVMGKAGRERYEALYGVEPMVAEYARLLRSLVCGGAGRGNRAGQ